MKARHDLELAKAEAEQAKAEAIKAEAEARFLIEQANLEAEEDLLAYVVKYHRQSIFERRRNLLACVVKGHRPSILKEVGIMRPLKGWVLILNRTIPPLTRMLNW